jgi:hypothetical protein
MPVLNRAIAKQTYQALEVYYDEDAIANIFGFSDLKKKHRITYDSDKEDAFLVHMDSEIIKFECSPDGLYQYSVSSRYQQGLKEDQKEDGPVT